MLAHVSMESPFTQRTRLRPAPASCTPRSNGCYTSLALKLYRSTTRPGCLCAVVAPTDYATSTTRGAASNNIVPHTSTTRIVKPAPSMPFAAGTAPSTSLAAVAAAQPAPRQVLLAPPAVSAEVLEQWTSVSKPLAGFSSAVGVLLLGALGTSLAALLASLGSLPAVPFLEPLVTALEQQQVPSDVAVHAVVIALLSTAGVILTLSTNAVACSLREAASGSTQWLQQQAASTAASIKESLDSEVQQELLIIKTLQSELEAEARRLHCEVAAAAGLQAQLREKQLQLEQHERTARRSSLAARLAGESLVASEAQLQEMQARLNVQEVQLSEADTQLDAADMQLRMADEALGVLGGALKKEAAARGMLTNDLSQVQRSLQAETHLRRETEAQLGIMWKELGGVLSSPQLTALQQRVSAAMLDPSMDAATAPPRDGAQAAREPRLRDLEALRLQLVAAQQGLAVTPQAVSGEGTKGWQQQVGVAASGAMASAEVGVEQREGRLGQPKQGPIARRFA